MSYSYFCVDCGRKLQGQDVVFNLSRMLGLERKEMSEDFEDPLTLYVSWETLFSYAKRSGVIQLENKKASRVRVTLKDVMELYAENAANPNERKKILEMNLDDIWNAKFVMYLKKKSGQNEAVIQQDIKDMGRRLRQTFSREEASGTEEGSPGKGKAEYYREFLIFPEYIEDRENLHEIYTVRYSLDLSNERKMESFRYAGEEIRGYCPHCHAPVLKGTGRYRHLPIGFVGGPRAGKTSLIVAMLLELLTKPDSEFPEAVQLVDSRINNLKRQEALYKKGWKIEKTLQESVRDSFNASVRVRKQNGSGEYVILTFVDIAGELCLNTEGKFDVRAAEKYPLIDQCSLYLLCTCITDAGFRVDGGMGGIDDGISEIVNGIADAFDRRGEYFPPLGIVLTKADYVRMMDDAGSVKRNPFRSIGHKGEYFRKGQEMLARLGKIYDMYSGDDDYNKPLSWVCRLFQNYREKTYLSMFYCSATGKRSEPYKERNAAPENIEQHLDSEGNKVQFKSVNVDALLRWIFQVTGCVPVEGSGYYCFDIPVYGEGYAGDKIKANPEIRQEWPWEQWRERNDAVCRLFLNQSYIDKEFEKNILADQEDSPVLKGLKRLVGYTSERRSRKKLRKYMERR